MADNCYISMCTKKTKFILTETSLYCTDKEVLVKYMFIMNARLKWNGNVL